MLFFRRRQLFFQLKVPFPDLVDGWVHQQFQQKGCQYATDQGRGDALHYVGPGTHGPENRDEPEKGRGHGHELRPQSLDRSISDGLLEIGSGSGGALPSWPAHRQDRGKGA